MAAALHAPRNDPNLYPRAVMTEFDFADDRYPRPPSQHRASQLQPSSRPGTGDRSWDPADNQFSMRDQQRQAPQWVQQNVPRTDKDFQYPYEPSIRPSDQLSDPPRSSLSYAPPPGGSRRVVERYSLEDNAAQQSQAPPSIASADKRNPVDSQSVQETVTAQSQANTPQASRMLPLPPQQSQSQGRSSPNPNRPSSSRRSTPQNGAVSANGPASPAGGSFPPIMPLSASPTYAPPVSPNPRAFPQQPIYVNQSNAPNPIQTVYTPIMPQQEEVCVECAMRDQDMADVDVTTPGVWGRESDVVFEELKRRELEDEASGTFTDDPSRVRIRGGRLTEQNLKLWLSINPREPASRQQTLNTYIKSQRSLLEAEALAHARAMQEAKQLDNRMRDAYSQLRRSAYDVGNSSSPTDDQGGVRIRTPGSPTSPVHNQHLKSHSREVTLLENGMIVEHVDVRKEEKDARDRRKREEKRARKSSRSSVLDVGSIISAQSNGQLAEPGLQPYSRYSAAVVGRPTSVLTAPADRVDIPRAYSQASFSDVQSLGSASPRRTRFFGMKNLSAGWRSQDSLAPSGMSGSMIDMHVALQREPHYIQQGGLAASPIDLNTPRRSQIWPPVEGDNMYPTISQASMMTDDKGKKKKGGLAKIWRIVTGKSEGNHHASNSYDRQRQIDDLPLAPPPPLSYLVDRKPGEFSNGGMRHASTPSLPSVTSPKFGVSTPGMSPPTAPSSVLPSPASLRPSGDIEISDGRPIMTAEINGYREEHERHEEFPKSQNWQSLQSMTSETDSRQQNLVGSPMPISNSSGNNSVDAGRPMSVVREKSLPPLPPGEIPHQVATERPKTFYDAHPPPGTAPAFDFLPPQAPFRTVDMRRQSFGGVSSRPNLTMPVTQPVDFDARRSFGPRYDEFGASRRSLGRLDQVQESSRSRSFSPLPSSKRKSKFGLSALLGKKSDKREHADYVQEGVAGMQPYPTHGYSPYDNQDDATTNYATSASRHSAISNGLPLTNGSHRTSMATRKPLEELVQQDADFIAYRYPSNNQRLDLLR